jgi:hypothetical protein
MSDEIILSTQKNFGLSPDFVCLSHIFRFQTEIDMRFFLTYLTMIFTQTTENQGSEAQLVARLAHFLMGSEGVAIKASTKRKPSTRLSSAPSWGVALALVLVSFVPAGMSAQVSNSTQGTSYSSIAAAINAANAGDVIAIAPGSYSEPQLTIDVTVTLTGAGSDQVMVTSTSNGYACSITADNVAMSGLTLIGGASTTYGVKASSCDDLALSDVVVTGTGKSAFDLNGVDTATLTNIEASSSVDGCGLAISSCANVTVNGLVTSNNAWGAAGVMPAATQYQNAIEAPTGIVFAGTLNLEAGDGGIAVQAGDLASGGVWTGTIAHNGTVDVLVPVSFSHVVSGNRVDGASAQVAAPQATAYAQAAANAGNASYTSVVIYDLVNGEWDVVAGLSIEDAIDASSSGDVISIGAGTYSEGRLDINHALTLNGAGRTDVTINSTSSDLGLNVAANNVGLNGLTLTNAGTYGIKVQPGVSPFSMSQVGVSGTGKSCVDLNGVSNATLSDLHLSSAADGYGLALASCSNVSVTNLTTSGNAWGDAAVFPSSLAVQASAGVGAPGSTVFAGIMDLNNDTGGIAWQSGDLNAGGVWEGTMSNDPTDGADITVPASLTHLVTGTALDGTLGQVACSQNAAYTTGLTQAQSPLFTDVTISDMDNGDWEVPAGMSIQDAIDAATSGDVVSVLAGSHTLDAQITVNKDITLSGAGSGTTSLTADFNAIGSAGTNPSMIQVNSAVEFNMSGLTLDGNAPTNSVRMGVSSYGTGGTISDNVFQNFAVGSTDGRGLALYGSNITVSGNSFSNIGRIGIHIRKAYDGSMAATNVLASGNTYTGKGLGSHLDFGIEVGSAASATLSNNVITACLCELE